MFSIATITFDNLDPAWFWVTAIALSIVVLVATYRGIHRRSGRRLAWLLLGMRVAGVLLLFMALVKPAWVALDVQTHRPSVAVVVDTSQSMSLPHRASDSGPGGSRYARARGWLVDSPAGERLRTRFDVHWFDIEGTALGSGDLSRALPLEPSEEQTDPVRALRAVEGATRGGRVPPVSGVVFLSDGRDTTGRGHYLGFGEYPLPVYAIGFRPAPRGAERGFDISVDHVEAPSRTLVHNAVAIKALLSKDGGPEMDVPLSIQRSGTSLAVEHVHLPEGPYQELVTISFTPEAAGDFVLAARAAGHAGERTTHNNDRLFKLRVDAEPIRVLYIEGVLRQEYRYLRARLQNDPDVQLITFVRSANPQQASVWGALAAAELTTRDRLAKLDVVLLGDFEARMLDDSAYEALSSWVQEGGGLMVLGGYSNLGPGGLGDTALADVLPVSLLQEPSGDLAQVERPFSFTLTPEGLGHPALVVTGDRAQDARLWSQLPRLGGVVATRGAKPGATVLARDPMPGAVSPEGAPLVVLATQGFGKGQVAALLADTTWRWSRIPRLSGAPDTMYVRFWSQMVRWLAGRDASDAGTALVVSTDQASYERARPVHIRVRRNPAFVLPEARAAGDDETAADGPLAGEGPATASRGPEPKPEVKISVRRPDGREAELPTRPDPTEPDAWAATYFADRGGRHQVEARLVVESPRGLQDAANEVTEFFVTGSGLELDDPATNPTVLAQIARLTGGVYADIDDPEATEALVEAIPARSVERLRTTRSAVFGGRGSPVLFALFLGLMTAEWVIRRRNQLV